MRKEEGAARLGSNSPVRVPCKAQNEKAPDINRGNSWKIAEFNPNRMQYARGFRLTVQLAMPHLGTVPADIAI